jgi:hypothetical protein
MANWEFLIQREGDRGWRPIETGNLQLKEGKYRIVANSQLLNTQIQLRIIHQTLGLAAPQQRSRSCNQISNARGLVVIIPFTHLQSGIWQFVCSGTTDPKTPWQRILKLRVLPRTSTSLPVGLVPETSKVAPSQPKFEQTEDDIALPTAPMVPISMLGEQENWADGLDRLLEQLERDSLQTSTRQSPVRAPSPGVIQLNTILAPPSQLISLNRSTFSGIIPGNQLTIAGECNLQLLKANLIQPKVEKLSICLRHPQTSEIVVSIEQSLPPNLNSFGFRGQLELPAEPKIGLLIGQVNLYDKHHIQLGSSGFTITLNLNPINESELSLLQLFDLSHEDSADTLDRLTQDLKIEGLTIGARGSSPRAALHPTRSTVQTLNPPQFPAVPLPYNPASSFTHPDITPVDSAPGRDILSPKAPDGIDPQLSSPFPSSFQPSPTDLSGDLEIDFDYPTLDLSLEARNYPNLEIVIDDEF